MAKKRIAHKIEIHHDGDDDTTFTKIACVRSITRPGASHDEVIVTCLDDDEEDARANPVRKNNDAKFVLFWDEADSDHEAIEALLGGDPTDWQIHFKFTDGTIAKQFEGWLKELGDAEHTVGEEITREAVIRVTSKPVTVVLP